MIPDNGRLKVCLYLALVVVTCVLLLVSFINPWWSASVGVNSTINVYGWGLRHNLEQLSIYFSTDRTPEYQTVLAFLYLAILVALVISSIWIRGKTAKWLLVIPGISYLFYVSIAVFIVVENRITEFNLPLQGNHQFGAISVVTALNSSFYIAFVAGLLCILLGIWHDQVMGKSEYAFLLKTGR